MVMSSSRRGERAAKCARYYAMQTLGPIGFSRARCCSRRTGALQEKRAYTDGSAAITICVTEIVLSPRRKLDAKGTSWRRSRATQRARATVCQAPPRKLLELAILVPSRHTRTRENDPHEQVPCRMSVASFVNVQTMI